jgi:hypothetical protein
VAPIESFTRFQLAAIIDSSDLTAGLAGWLACWLLAAGLEERGGGDAGKC